MKKRKILFLVTSLMMFSLCACEKSKNKQEEKTEEHISTTTESTTESTTELTTESLSEETTEDVATKEVFLPSAGVHSMDNLLVTAMQPVGQTMYIWGGGWNEADTGSGVETVTIGLSDRWKEFYEQQDAGYDYNQTRYQIHDGLDCTGYIGWLVFNVVESHNKTEEEGGYVMYGDLSYILAEEYHFGSFTPIGEVDDFKPGDIMCMDTHIWMSLGSCEDGSVLLVHSSPPGVKISGTKLPDGSKSQAITLAEEYMSTYFPKWYSRYPDCSVDYNYLTTASRMRWDTSFLEDPNHLQDMTAKEVMEFLFKP